LRAAGRLWGGIVDRVSSCSGGEKGESAEYGRASGRCSRVSKCAELFDDVVNLAQDAQVGSGKLMRLLKVFK
jgi:hypothetical protein